MRNITIFSLLMLLVLSISLYAGDCKKAESKTVDMKISGMTCDNCVQKVKTSLEKVDGVSGVDVTLADHSANVTFDPNKTSTVKLQEAIHTTGFKVESMQTNAAKTCCSADCSCCSPCSGCKATHKTDKI